MSKIHVDVINDFTLNDDIFTKYIPDYLRRKVYEIQKNVLQKHGSHYAATRHIDSFIQPKSIIKDIPKESKKIFQKIKLDNENQQI